ncbi:hypothetical protein [Corynebacterium gerontici]|uniref:Transposase DDE domain-containing protein n=1 Tax=Corynebacterium gerontici TaxID=2079234 RepID=A0A3G6J344_9CORY|nr:hypothetical protein [Corynebacterium gerontici]AZA12336.1 hypothetical protein CGERO_10260 [Corynebacterium gerontici]
MSSPDLFTWLAAAYAIFLLGVAWGFDRMAQHTSNRTSDMRTGTFRYVEKHDAWQCPEDHWLWPSSFDPENRVMRYRAHPTVCNNCPVKQTCTASAHGREVTRQLDPWPHSDSGRFHRGIALGVALMGLILPLVSLIQYHSLADLLLIGAVLVIMAGGTIPLAKHLWNTPSNFPTAVHVPHLDDRQAEIEAAVDRYARRYGSDARKLAEERKRP